MSRPSLDTIDTKLEQVISDVQEIRTTKADKDTLVLELQAIRTEVQAVKDNVQTLNGYGRWLILLIMTAVVSAILKLVLVAK